MTISEIEERLTTLTRERDALRVQVDMAKSKPAAGDWDSLQRAREQLRGEFDKLRNEHDNLKIERNALLNDCSNLRSDCEYARTQLVKERDKNASDKNFYTQTISSLRTEAEVLRRENDKLNRFRREIDKAYVTAKSVGPVDFATFGGPYGFAGGGIIRNGV